MSGERLTESRHGSAFPLSKYTRAFIRFARKRGGVVLDIGAGYGTASVPALSKRTRVIANDISRAQLEQIRQAAPAELASNLVLLEGAFPHYDLEASSLDAILASHVLHFLAPDDFRVGITRLYDWLKPEGKAFVLCFTPYHRFMAKMIPDYERAVASGSAWPGLTENSDRYALVPKLLPATVNLMDPTVLAREFLRAGFRLECVEFTPCPRGLNPEYFPLDGREWAGLIAYKSA
ncbi:Methyltransferase domain protein [Caballeronia glebae]|uniref:Methyltransferase domain protein n=1 Tax=Caballeronia glebae TaxID=1777143 RepID=A0A157ZDR7_9BURK|nr:class I SAM-dependent methyltransferase [Caballeronia glebae]SAK43676.1 Methyltransferase domain protein [Caballeronia glebae]